GLLFSGSGESRQFGNVPRVVLDDDGGFQVRCELFETIQRSQRLGAAGIESRHTVAVIVLAKVSEIAGDEHITLVFELDQQTVVGGRMSRRAQHDDTAVAEHIFVPNQRLYLAAAAD